MKVNSADSIEVGGLESFDPEWFRGGQLHWNTGENSEQKIEVLDHIVSNGTVMLTLWQAMPYEISLGDTFTVSAGCAKDFTTCKDKFSNAENFRGFPHMPGNKFALGYAGNRDNFDGGLLNE